MSSTSTRRARTCASKFPRDIVDAEIDRVARDYSRKARIPGFRPGKAPARVIKQRFKDQILHDVAHDLDSARRRRCAARAGRGGGRHARRPRRDGRGRAAAHLHGVVRHGAGVRAGRSRHAVAFTRAVERGRRRSGRARAAAPARARRAVRAGRRARRGSTATRSRSISSDATQAAAPDTHKDVTVELGAKANPPGFDEQLLGLEPARRRRSRCTIPADYPIGGARQHRRLVYR